MQFVWSDSRCGQLLRYHTGRFHLPYSYGLFFQVCTLLDLLCDGVVNVAATSTEYVSLMVLSSITVAVLWMLWLLEAATSTEYVSLMVLPSITVMVL